MGPLDLVSLAMHPVHCRLEAGSTNPGYSGLQAQRAPLTSTMTSMSPESEVKAAFQEIQADVMVMWAAFTLVVYDFIITVPNALEVAWRRPFTVTTALFVTTRWMMLAIVIANVVPITPASNCAASLQTSGDFRRPEMF